MSQFAKSAALAVLVLGSVVGSATAGQFRNSGFSDRAIIIVSGKGDAVSLNPQPLPPREETVFIGGGAGGDVSLNPQPLPPKEMGVTRKVRF